MTVVCAIRTAEAIILGADSQSTMRLHNLPAPHNVATTYSHAEKLGQLLPEKNIAWLAWGAGSIGGISIREAAARFPQFLESLSEQKDNLEWYALRFRDLLISLHQNPSTPAHNAKPHMQIAICGFVGNQSQIWTIACTHGEWQACQQHKDNLLWAGDGSEAIQRLVSGFNSAFINQLDNYVPQANQQRRLKKEGQLQIIHPEMPLGDAIACMQFLLNTSYEFNQFVQAPNSVGKPFDIATLSIGSGYNWITGKHCAT